MQKKSKNWLPSKKNFFARNDPKRLKIRSQHHLCSPQQISGRYLSKKTLVIFQEICDPGYAKKSKNFKFLKKFFFARNNLKCLKICSQKFSKFANFLTFFAYPGSQISWKMTNVFFERYRPEICRGLHKWCCERILRRFGSFRAKKIFFEGSQFFYFFCIPGSQILEKWLTTFLRDTGLKFVVDCTNGAANEF